MMDWRSLLQRGLAGIWSGIDRSLHGAPQHLPELMRGAACGVAAGLKVFHTQLSSGSYRKFLGAYTWWTVVFYGVFLALAFTILAPVFALMLFVAPGMIAQLAIQIPHWAYEVTADQHPGLFSNLFLSELRTLDEEYAKGVSAAVRAQPDRATFMQRLSRRATTRWTGFFRRSIWVTVVGVIPIVGPIIATLGHWIHVSEELGWSLLGPWSQAKGFTPEQRNTFLEQHKFVIIGFCMPFVILNSVPFLGGFAGSVAEGAAAHLVYYILAPPQTGVRATDARAQREVYDEASDKLHNSIGRVRRSINANVLHTEHSPSHASAGTSSPAPSAPSAPTAPIAPAPSAPMFSSIPASPMHGEPLPAGYEETLETASKPPAKSEPEGGEFYPTSQLSKKVTTPGGGGISGSLFDVRSPRHALIRTPRKLIGRTKSKGGSIEGGIAAQTAL